MTRVTKGRGFKPVMLTQMIRNLRKVTNYEKQSFENSFRLDTVHGVIRSDKSHLKL